MKKFSRHVTIRGAISFFLTLTTCLILIGITIFNRIRVERLTMEQLIAEKSAKAVESISRLLYKTQALSALVLQSDGRIEDFDRVAAIIVDSPSILNLIVAPGGVVTNVYPLAGNEAVVGFDFFSENSGNKEALLAKETGELVLGGPFSLVQGGSAIVGRLPVFMDESGEKSFWGLVSITLKYPQVLEEVGLTELRADGLAFEIWRINPDDNQKQIIATSGGYNGYTSFVEKEISILNAHWYFRILSVRAWYEYPETWMLLFLSFCISSLMAFIVQNNEELKRLKTKFEDMAYTDSLTDIFNRRYFMDFALAQAERAMRLNTGSFIVLIDVDHFKRINDTYGHLTGDEALKWLVKKTQSIIRPYDLFARYGGEEFIIFISDVDQEGAMSLAERIRQSVMESPIEYKGKSLYITISLGVARVTPGGDLFTAIDKADAALYKAKEEGRNKTVFYKDSFPFLV